MRGEGVRPARILRSRFSCVGALAVVLSVLVMCLPSAYVVESPGPTANVLGNSGGRPIITVTGAPTHRDAGRLMLVTVNASGVPGYPVTNAEALWGWLSPHETITPSEAVFPPGQTSSQYRKESDRQMSSSQRTAVRVALGYAKRLGVDTQGVSAVIRVDDIGGPSAGMMYTLGLIDLLTAGDETGGKAIAGTGTIASDGAVGEIGGIRLKMQGAKRDGARWFLAPKANCPAVVGHVPRGLRVVRVSNIDEAYRAVTAIGKGRGGSLPSCG